MLFIWRCGKVDGGASYGNVTRAMVQVRIRVPESFRVRRVQAQGQLGRQFLVVSALGLRTL